MHISYVAIGDRVRLCEREKDRAEKLEGRYFSSRGKHKNERCLGGEEIKKNRDSPRSGEEGARAEYERWAKLAQSSRKAR